MFLFEFNSNICFFRINFLVYSLNASNIFVKIQIIEHKTKVKY